MSTVGSNAYSGPFVMKGVNSNGFGDNRYVGTFINGSSSIDSPNVMTSTLTPLAQSVTIPGVSTLNIGTGIFTNFISSQIQVNGDTINSGTLTVGTGLLLNNPSLIGYTPTLFSTNELSAQLTMAVQGTAFNAPFNITYTPNITGSVKTLFFSDITGQTPANPGNVSTSSGNIPLRFRPAANYTFVCLGQTNGTDTQLQFTINTDGTITFKPVGADFGTSGTIGLSATSFNYI